MQAGAVRLAQPADRKTKQLVLLVEPEESDRTRLGGWLEEAGYGVIDCPGPRREDFTCLGVRGERCALVEIADLAILDGRTVFEASSDPQAATRLLRYYLASDKPVLVLADGIGAEFSFEDDRVAVASRASRPSVLAAVRELFEIDRVA